MEVTSPSPLSNECASPDSAYHSSTTDGSSVSGRESPADTVIVDVVSQTPRLPTMPAPQHMAPGPIHSKRYLCQRCLNHGLHFQRKGHKPFCRHANCNCEMCVMVDERRRLNNAICRQVTTNDDDADDPNDSKGKVRDPKCARCSAHGEQNRLRGHKRRCPYASCECDLCKLVDERRGLMAKQIKLRRQQKSELQRRSQVFAPEALRQSMNPADSIPLEMGSPVNSYESLLTNPLLTGLHSSHHPTLSCPTSGFSSSLLAGPAPRSETVYVPVPVQSICPNHQCVKCFQDFLDKDRLAVQQMLRSQIASNSTEAALAEMMRNLSARPTPTAESDLNSSPIAMVLQHLLAGGGRPPISQCGLPPSQLPSAAASFSHLMLPLTRP